MAYRTRHYTKYGNKKVVAYGISFDSKREAKRYSELRLLERAGKIKNLELQKEFVLIPNQYDGVTGKLLERSCRYRADFCYYDCEKLTDVCEDTKGVSTADYIIKRKLMLFVHGIEVKEI
jgi:hypothetical protein